MIVNYVKKLLIFFCLAACARMTTLAETKPNILFIALDDMNDWTHLFDENNPIHTPNLQRLASRGMFFENAYCASPACSPSRAAVMTGRAPHKSGIGGNGAAWAKKVPDAEVIPRWFLKHGKYDTRAGGKIFHHGKGGDDPPGKPSFQKVDHLHKHAGKPELNYNGYTKGRLRGSGFDWGEHNVDMHCDDYTVEWGSKIMHEEWKEGMTPQFLALGIFRPHLPFWAPSRFFEKYPANEKLILPPMLENDFNDIPEIGIKMTLKEGFFQDTILDQKDYSVGSNEQLVRCYQAASTFADDFIGRILDELDKTGQADNTIIVLWSDHGYHLGDKNCFVKFTLWEKANHVPFIVVAPGITKPGSRCTAPVSLLDIYPTLVELARLPANPKNDGVSLVPLLKDPQTKWERPALMTFQKGNHAIKTRDYRYIRYNDGSEELYAHADNWNHTNLVGNPEYTSVLEGHRILMDGVLE
ncbi:MAG: sulfatase [Planctomycetes bacterium]|nr:sulfatase [Planctomycetota bacterium]